MEIVVFCLEITSGVHPFYFHPRDITAAGRGPRPSKQWCQSLETFQLEMVDQQLAMEQSAQLAYNEAGPPQPLPLPRRPPAWVH